MGISGLRTYNHYNLWKGVFLSLEPKCIRTDVFFPQCSISCEKIRNACLCMCEGNMQSDVEGPNIVEVEVTVLQSRLLRFYTLIIIGFVM